MFIGLRNLALSCILVLLPLQSFARAGESQYTLSKSTDITLSITALLVAGTGTYLYNQMDIPNEKDMVKKGDLLPWDRKFAGRYSSSADFISDVGSLFAIAPLAIGGYAWYSGNSNSQEFWTFTAMFFQSILFQHGINIAVRSLELWPRPYTYASSGEGQEKAKNAKAEAYGSFFSGHASAAFTVAAFTSEWFSATHSNPDAIRVVRALAFSLASFESVLRVAAGKHYPTDVAVGAIVGTAISYGILELHKVGSKKYALWAGPGVAGVTFRF